ncbi:Uncharacterized protein conserved in bacteria DUF885 [Elusimicrobium minutum Pei191]|uniref:Uncharacterized protein conserved in bacteria DUF885 n=1 Tax=Elusimicrobium minutum (strain Pei191) TaxID=445932 RepID=B2KCN0_ELUMP|nr:DUF885 family protein [Elusimicrobium minutum]ACC98276.1 Uncharacterized protein conserved in bacteria DUF885 [Elusimicrobium minutum Pei191]
MKKIFYFCVLFFLGAPLFAADLDKEINSMMGKYALFEITNSYMVMLETLYPERATRAGFEIANTMLDERSQKADGQRRDALAQIKVKLSKVKKKKLTHSEKTDYEIISRTLAFDNYLLNKRLFETSPLYYLEAQDAVYDIMLKQINSIRQFKEVQPRLTKLPDVFIAGVNNIPSASKTESALAINKAYAAYTSISDYEDFLKKNADDAVDRTKLQLLLNAKKAALREFFNYIKALNENAKKVTNKNDSDYRILLKNSLHLDKTPEELTKTAEAAIKKSKSNLILMISAITGKEKAEIKDFYNIEAKDKTAPDYPYLLKTVGDEIENANKAMKGVLPASEMRVFVNHMPQYPSFLNPVYMFLPPYGIEHNLIGTLFIYTPQDNPRARTSHINKNFNMSRIKMLVTESVVPGRQMFYSYSYDTKPIRRILASNAMVDGWAVYAKHLAFEVGYLSSKEDALYLSYEDYARAVKALADIKYNTKQLDYDETALFIVSQGIKKEEAEIMTRQIAFNPGQVVAELAAYEEIKRQRSKYETIFGKDFSLASFHNKIFTIGKIPLSMLDSELMEEYKKEKRPGLKVYKPTADL